MHNVNCPSNIPDSSVCQKCLVIVQLEDRICTLEGHISTLVGIKQIEGFFRYSSFGAYSQLRSGRYPSSHDGPQSSAGTSRQRMRVLGQDFKSPEILFTLVSNRFCAPGSGFAGAVAFNWRR